MAETPSAAIFDALSGEGIWPKLRDGVKLVERMTSRVQQILLRTICIVLFTYQIPNALAQTSLDIPLDDPVMNAVNRLSDQGILTEDIRSIRPLSIEQLRRLSLELPKSSDAKLIRDWLEARSILPGTPHLSWIEGRIRMGLKGTNSDSSVVPGVQARVNPLLEEVGGRWQKGGIFGWMAPTISAQWRGWGAFELTPLFPVLWSSEGGRGESLPEVFSGYLRLGQGGVDVTIGQFPVRWGPGRSGSLILGGTQHPFPALQIRNAIPARLPFFGLSQFSMIVARLDDDQFFPNPYMVVERMVVQPTDILELGFSQAVLLGGTGSPPLSSADAIAEVLGYRRGEVTTVNLSNRNFLVDAQIVLPGMAHTVFYTEFYFDDCCSARWLRNMNNLAGISVPRIGSAEASLTFEWVRTTSITYRNSTFRSGFEHRNHLLGHTLGPDAMGWYLFGDLPKTPWATWELQAAFERRGRLELPEDRLRFVATPTFPLGPRSFLKASAGFEWVKNNEFNEGETRLLCMGGVELGSSF